MSFTNKVVIVTGASSGIGRATAIAFNSEGAKVVLVARNEDKLKEVANICKNALIVVADVTRDDNVRNIVDQTIAKYNQIDVLVNNAAILKNTNSLIEGDIMENFDEIMAINLRATVLLTNISSPYLVKTKGCVINISSVAGTLPPKREGLMSYHVSKAALDHFTKCAAVELGPYGVRVNAISPGPVATNILRDAPDHDTWDRFSGMTLLNRVGQPEEIADLVLFMAGDKAKSVTGSNYVSDNGMSIKIPK